MRKIGLVAGVLLSIATGTAQAQTDKPSYALDRGSLLAGGSASFTSTGTNNDSNGGDSDRNVLLSVNPNVQYFVRPGLALGGSLSLSYQSRGGNSSTGIGVGPRITYFFGGPETRLHPLLSASASFGRVGYADTSFTQSGYRASAGALYLLTQAVGITSELFYQASSFDGDSGINTFGLAFGLNAFVF